MSKIITVGLDLAKNVFQVRGAGRARGDLSAHQGGAGGVLSELIGLRRAGRSRSLCS